MDTTTQEPRRLRPAAGRGGSPTPRRPPQAGDHGGGGRARSGAPSARGGDNRGGDNRGGDNRGGNARGSDRGGPASASSNRGGSNSRGASSRAVTSGRVNGADTSPANGGRRHLRVVGQPAARDGLGQSAPRAAARPSVARQAGPAAAVPLPRIPFVLLVLALLGGGLICLLVVNTTLGATSFRISQLQSDNAKLSLQEQTLLDQVAKEQSPAGIEQRAYQLGMRTPATSNILDLRNHRFARVPDHPGALGEDAAVAPPAGKRTAHTARVTRVRRAARAKRAKASTGTGDKAGSGR
jgi:hypothetical protein